MEPCTCALPQQFSRAWARVKLCNQWHQEIVRPRERTRMTLGPLCRSHKHGAKRFRSGQVASARLACTILGCFRLPSFSGRVAPTQPCLTRTLPNPSPVAFCSCPGNPRAVESGNEKLRHSGAACMVPQVQKLLSWGTRRNPMPVRQGPSHCAQSRALAACLLLAALGNLANLCSERDGAGHSSILLPPLCAAPAVPMLGTAALHRLWNRENQQPGQFQPCGHGQAARKLHSPRFHPTHFAMQAEAQEITILSAPRV